MNEDALVSTQIQTNDWVLTFRHPLSPHNRLISCYPLTVLHQHANPKYTRSDQINWDADSSAIFTVRSKYHLLQPARPTGRVAKNLRKTPAFSLKIKISMWFVVLDRLPTIDYLHPQHYGPFSPCLLCGSQNETVIHIFLSCHFFRLCEPPSLTLWG